MSTLPTPEEIARDAVAHMGLSREPLAEAAMIYDAASAARADRAASIERHARALLDALLAVPTS